MQVKASSFTVSLKIKSYFILERKNSLLGLISNYSKVARYKVNIKKSISFLYISNEQVEFEIKNINIYLKTVQNEVDS